MPSAPPSVRSRLVGYFVRSTIDPAPVATLKGKVASGEERRKSTDSPFAVTDWRVSRSAVGPTSELMRLTRSKEYLTSLPVTSRPLGNFRPWRRVQR